MGPGGLREALFAQVINSYFLIQYFRNRAVFSVAAVQFTAGRCCNALLIFLFQMSITLKYGVRGTGDAKLRTQLYDQLLEFVDILLNGSKCHRESLQGSDKKTILDQQFQQECTHFIEPFGKERSIL